QDSPQESFLHGGQVLSEGVPRGAVQVPPGGDPIILMADAQTTGGYAVPAVVIAADHWRSGQLRPGDVVRFLLVAEDQDLAALVALHTELQHALQETGPTRGGLQVPDSTRLMRGFAEWSDAAELLTTREEDGDAN